MTAEQVLPGIIKLIEARPDLRWIHPPDSRKIDGTPGFPDLLIVGPRRILFVEVKPSRHTQLERDQIGWRYALIGAGSAWRLWGAEDLADGSAELALDKLAGG